MQIAIRFVIDWLLIAACVAVGLVLISFGGLQPAIKFTTSHVETVDGLTSGCQGGTAFSYRYQVSGKAYFGRASVCKTEIPAGRPVQVFYAADDPQISITTDPVGSCATCF